MWQQIIVGVLVVAATIYAARKLGPRRWRQRASAASGTATGAADSAAGSCGCDKGGDGCH